MDLKEIKKNYILKRNQSVQGLLKRLVHLITLPFQTDPLPWPPSQELGLRTKPCSLIL